MSLVDDHRGMTPARRKHIHDHRSYADSYGAQLPFEIGKPKRTKPKNVEVVCGCGKVMWVNKTTYIVICNGCKRLITVN